MQITVHLNASEIVLPLAACETVQGLLYRAISQDPVYARKVHETGRSFDGRKFKLFTFGELVGRYTVENSRIFYSNGVQLTVRAADPYMIQLLLQYFQKDRQVQLGDNTVTVSEALLEDTHIFGERVQVRTLSPVTVYVTEEDGRTVYFSPENPRFCEGIVSNARRKWASWRGSEDGFSLQVRTVENARYIKRATRFKTTFITAWHGPLLLEGAPQVLDFLYHTGLGSKNSQGFGMFEVKR